jgi:hypothetical protein
MRANPIPGILIPFIYGSQHFPVEIVDQRDVSDIMSRRLLVRQVSR